MGVQGRRALLSLLALVNGGGDVGTAEVPPTSDRSKQFLRSRCSFPPPHSPTRRYSLQMMIAVQEAGLIPDIDMLAAAMDACYKARDTEGAMHFMDQAIRLGLKPDDNMFREVRSVVRACVPLLFCAYFVCVFFLCSTRNLLYSRHANGFASCFSPLEAPQDQSREVSCGHRVAGLERTRPATKHGRACSRFFSSSMSLARRPPYGTPCDGGKFGALWRVNNTRSMRQGQVLVCPEPNPIQPAPLTRRPCFRPCTCIDRPFYNM